MTWPPLARKPQWHPCTQPKLTCPRFLHLISRSLCQGGIPQPSQKAIPTCWSESCSFTPSTNLDGSTSFKNLSWSMRHSTFTFPPLVSFLARWTFGTFFLSNSLPGLVTAQESARIQVCVCVWDGLEPASPAGKTRGWVLGPARHKLASWQGRQQARDPNRASSGSPNGCAQRKQCTLGVKASTQDAHMQK